VTVTKLALRMREQIVLPHGSLGVWPDKCPWTEPLTENVDVYVREAMADFLRDRHEVTAIVYDFRQQTLLDDFGVESVSDW
jgi:hypothetical protein